jgi:hypothetical protein
MVMKLSEFLEEMKVSETKVKVLFDAHPKPSEEQVTIIAENKKLKEAGKELVNVDKLEGLHMPGSNAECAACIALNDEFQIAVAFEKEHLGKSRYEEKTFLGELEFVKNIVLMLREEEE